MTERDDEGNELSVPASVVVGRFSEQVEGLINTSVGEVVRANLLWWHILAVLAASAVAAATSWLILTYSPHPHASDITVRRGVEVERCVRDATAPADHPLFVCVSPPR